MYPGSRFRRPKRRADEPPVEGIDRSKRHKHIPAGSQEPTKSSSSARPQKRPSQRAAVPKRDTRTISSSRGEPDASGASANQAEAFAAELHGMVVEEMQVDPKPGTSRRAPPVLPRPRPQLASTYTLPPDSEMPDAEPPLEEGDGDASAELGEDGDSCEFDYEGLYDDDDDYDGGYDYYTTDEDDENSESNYRADYPEFDCAWSDQVGGNPYRYYRGDDDEHDGEPDEDDGEFLWDDEEEDGLDQSPLVTPAKLIKGPMGKYLNPSSAQKVSEEDEDDDKCDVD